MDECAEECPAVVKVLQESGITIAALFKLIKIAHPRFKFTKMKVHWHLSDADKEKRVTTCQLLLQNFSHLLHRMVFIDAKTIYMWEKDIYGWVDTSVDNYADGIKPARYKRQIIRLKYYAAVHMKLGPVFLKYYTGTTGMDNNHDGHNYQVGSGYEKLRRAPTPHMTHSLRQLGSPSRALRLARLDGLVNTQPHQAFALRHCCLSIQLILQLPDSHAVVSVVALVSSLLICPSPCISMSRPLGAASTTSHAFFSGHTVTPIFVTGLSCLFSTKASVAYSKIKGSASHNAYKTLSHALPCLAHTRQLSAVLLWLADRTPLNTTCLVPGWQDPL